MTESAQLKKDEYVHLVINIAMQILIGYETKTLKVKLKAQLPGHLIRIIIL